MKTGPRITLQLDPEHIETLKELARTRERSVSFLVRQAVAAYLETQGFTVSVSRSKNTRAVLHGNGEATS